jgi:hypothetical protein
MHRRERRERRGKYRQNIYFAEGKPIQKVSCGKAKILAVQLKKFFLCGLRVLCGENYFLAR